jgi:hypothetical protein
MKITVDHLGHQASLEDEDVVDICEAIDLFEEVLKQSGFSAERIEGGFLVKAKQINQEI